MLDSELSNYEREFRQKKRDFDLLESQKEEELHTIRANERITVGQIVSVFTFDPDSTQN